MACAIACRGSLPGIDHSARARCEATCKHLLRVRNIPDTFIDSRVAPRAGSSVLSAKSKPAESGAGDDKRDNPKRHHIGRRSGRDILDDGGRLTVLWSVALAKYTSAGAMR